jgi:hypothetical protein
MLYKYNQTNSDNFPRRHPYFDVVVGLCGHMIPRAMLAVAYAIGRASHARQVKGDDSEKKGYPGPPGWGFGVGLKTPHSKKLIVTKVEKRKTWIDLMMMERVGDR